MGESQVIIFYMQCVILAAGKGTRMRPLTDICPKPLLRVAGKPILQHSIESLPAVIDEVVIVVSYLKEQIMDFFGSEYMGKKITYCEQVNPAGGTGDALMCTKDVVKGKFLFLNGDDIYGKDGLEKAMTYDHMIFGYHSDFPERFGVLVPNGDGTLKGIIEKPANPPSNHINIGGYVLNDSIFTYKVPLAVTGELYVTDIVTAYAQVNPVQIVEQDLWIPIGYPDDIAKAEAILAEAG
jgi:bifunctional UDP-N-acetylglucosamine pyrophosphorylase/glucosamine-1-phosphate N-acetyltransferase